MPRRYDLCTGSAFVVDHLGRGQVHHAPTAILDAPAPVQLLGIHEKALIEETSFLDGLTPHHHTRPDDPVHVLHSVVGPVQHVVLSSSGIVRPPLMQHCAFQKGRGQGGKATTRGLNAAVGETELRTNYANVEMGIHEIYHRFQRIADQLRVRVQQQHIARQCEREIGDWMIGDWTVGGIRPEAEGTQGLVVGGGEAQVVLVGDELDLREMPTHHLGAAVAGSVIHHHDVKRQVRWDGVKDRCQTAAQQVADVPAHHDDSDIDHLRRSTT